MIFIIDIYPLFANPLCYEMYRGNHYESDLSALSPTLAQIANLFEIPTAEQAKLMRSYSDESLSKIRDEVKAKEEVIEHVKKLPSERMAELKEVVQKLMESGFLLSPFHEILFLKSIDLSADKVDAQEDHLHGLKYFSGALEVQKTNLNGVSLSIQGSANANRLSRQQIAKKMLFNLQRNPLNLYRWKILSSDTRSEMASEFIKSTRLKMKIPDLIKILDRLSDLANSEKENILLQVLELTLPDIYSVSRARARGFSDNMITKLTPSLLGVALFGGSVGEVLYLSGAPTDFLIATGSMFSVIGLFVGNAALPWSRTIQEIPRVPGKIRSFAVSRWKRRSIEERTLNKAKAEIDGIATEGAKLSGIDDLQKNQQDAQLDLDFNAIKLELKNRNLQGPIEISKWGSEFQIGFTNLVERGHLLSSRVENALKNSQKLQTEPSNEGITASQRNQLRSSLNSQTNFINDSLVVAFGMKADLLSLTAALDRYDELASQLNQRNLTSAEKSILDLTTRNLLSFKMQISALASLLVNSEQALINELSIAKINLLNINAGSLIKSY